jgi:hypothetical protein
MSPSSAILALGHGTTRRYASAPVPETSGPQGMMAAFWFRGVVYLTRNLLYFPTSPAARPT